MSSSSCHQLLPVLLLFCGFSCIHGNNQQNSNGMELIIVANQSYCSVRCKSRLHTMCELEKPQSCNDHRFADYNIKELASLKMQERLIQGHNGLRDRIARIMNVSNMVALSWHVELAVMASKYSHYCTPFVDDECTHFEASMNYKDRVTRFSQGTDAHKFVAQNRFCLQAKYLPKNFVELAMHNWYFDKNALERPVRHVDTHYMIKLGTIQGENNFTHLAFPLTYTFGCGLSRFDSYYCIVCNYYPYYRSENNTMLFESGKPTSACPTYFPLKKLYFRHLCSNKNNTGQTTSAAVMPLAVYIISIIFI